MLFDLSGRIALFWMFLLSLWRKGYTGRRKRWIMWNKAASLHAYTSSSQGKTLMALNPWGCDKGRQWSCLLCSLQKRAMKWIQQDLLLHVLLIACLRRKLSQPKARQSEGKMVIWLWGPAMISGATLQAPWNLQRRCKIALLLLYFMWTVWKMCIEEFLRACQAR